MINFNLAMLLIAIEYFLALFFIGNSINITIGRDASNKTVPHIDFEWFPLLFGIALLVLAVMQKVI